MLHTHFKRASELGVWKSLNGILGSVQDNPVWKQTLPPSSAPSGDALAAPCSAFSFTHVSVSELAQMCSTQRLLLSLGLPLSALSRLCLVILFLWLSLNLYSFVKCPGSS